MESKETILIVDDDSDTRTVVRTILTTEDYKVSEVASGEQAIEYLRTNTAPALVILDIMMPGMSGLEVAMRMKQHPETQNIPIIILTAKGDSQDLLTAYKDYAVDYYISKPFTSKQLLNGIKIVLGNEEEEGN